MGRMVISACARKTNASLDSLGVLPSQSVRCGARAARPAASREGDDARLGVEGRRGVLAAHRDVEDVPELIVCRTSGAWLPNQAVEGRGVTARQFHPCGRLPADHRPLLSVGRAAVGTALIADRPIARTEDDLGLLVRLADRHGRLLAGWSDAAGPSGRAR